MPRKRKGDEAEGTGKEQSVAKKKKKKKYKKKKKDDDEKDSESEEEDETQVGSLFFILFGLSLVSCLTRGHLNYAPGLIIHFYSG